MEPAAHNVQKHMIADSFSILDDDLFVEASCGVVIAFNLAWLHKFNVWALLPKCFKTSLLHVVFLPQQAGLRFAFVGLRFVLPLLGYLEKIFVNSSAANLLVSVQHRRAIDKVSHL